MKQVKSETKAVYNKRLSVVQPTDHDIIEQAKQIINRRLYDRVGDVVNSPSVARDFVKLHIGHEEREVFGVLFLDSQNVPIEFEIVFRGTVDRASVYPREVVKAALKHNACAVILTHNHPSGKTEPSDADILITETLKIALELIDVRVLDHLIVGRDVLSMAEKG
jgi:DNA repair protein RadC